MQYQKLSVLLNHQTDTTMKNTIKVQMKDIQIGDVVMVRYAEQTVFAKVARIEEDFQKNGVRVISLFRSQEEVAMGKSEGIWTAKETTYIKKEIVNGVVDVKLSKILSNILFNQQGA